MQDLVLKNVAAAAAKIATHFLSAERKQRLFGKAQDFFLNNLGLFMKKVLGVFLGISLSLAGCSATTSFDSVQPETSLRINKTPAFQITDGNSQTYSTTSFGQYRFKAEQAGNEPMYGLIPLKFNGGYLAADILFFAPAMFFNLREVFPYYEFDLEANEIRYKKKETDSWTSHTPKQEEIAAAKTFFGE